VLLFSYVRQTTEPCSWCGSAAVASTARRRGSRVIRERPRPAFAFTIARHSACHAGMPAYPYPDAARWGRVTPGERIWLPNDAHLRRIATEVLSHCPMATKRRWRCWAISASWRNGAPRPGYPAATAAGLSSCRRGPSRPMNASRSMNGGIPPATRRDFSMVPPSMPQ